MSHEKEAWLVALVVASTLIIIARQRHVSSNKARNVVSSKTKPKSFRAIFSLNVQDAPGCVTEALSSCGGSDVIATQVGAQLVVATFTVSHAGGFRHGPGQEVVHRCYLACQALQAASLIPDDAEDYSSYVPTAPLHAGLGDGGLASSVTVVVTTSPMRGDPELEMLEIVFASLRLAGLHACRKLLICDNKNEDAEGAADETITLKRATLPKPFMLRYRERMARLKRAEWAADVEVVELPNWHGFALGTRHALSLVTTPLVVVIQHDLAFLRRIDLRPVAEQLLRAPRAPSSERVNYVVFPRATQHGYRRELLLRTGLRVGAPVDFDGAAGTVPLTRFPQFLDGTHLARCDWYRHLFRRAEKEAAFAKMVGHGSTRFSQEMTLGPYMLALAKTAAQRVPVPRATLTAVPVPCATRAAVPRAKSRRDGDPSKDCKEEEEVSLGVLRVCAEFGGWLWNAEDKQGFVVFHLDASRHHAQWECDETGTPPSQLLEHYRHAAAAQARGEPVEAVLKYVPQTTGKRVLAESGLCQKYAS